MAEPGVINDVDGYTNVRERGDSKSKVIGKLVDGQVFDFNFLSIKDRWAQVSFVKNGKRVRGFMHGSRILALDSLKKAEKGRVKVEYTMKDFNVGEYRVSMSKEGGV